MSSHNLQPTPSSPRIELPLEDTDPIAHPLAFCRACRHSIDHRRDIRVVECLRCKVAHYCNVSCRLRHLQDHKKECRLLQQIHEALQGDSMDFIPDDDFHQSHSNKFSSKNMFLESVGYLWSTLETADDDCARIKYAQQSEELSEHIQAGSFLQMVFHHHLKILEVVSYDTQSSYMKMYKHYLTEVLCVISYPDQHGLHLWKISQKHLTILQSDVQDFFSIRVFVPFLLFSLGRSDLCMAFVRHWIYRTFDPNDLGAMQPLYEQSHPRAWLYGNASPFENPFQIISNADPKQAPLFLLTSLLLISLLNIARYGYRLQQLRAFVSSSFGRHISEDNLKAIIRIYQSDGYHPKNISEEARRAEFYIDTIHERNATLLPAVINPERMKWSDPPAPVQIGTPSEVFYVVHVSHTLFSRIPGAIERLKRRFGENPDYNFDLQERHQ